MKLFCAADAGRLRPGRRGGACLLLAVLFLCVLMTGAASAATGNWMDAGNYNASWLGDYSATYYYITCNEDLAAFAVAVNNDTGLYNFSGKTVTVTNSSLDLSAHYWTPIGNTTEYSPTDKIFKGTFDGGGKTISNMNVSVALTSDTAYAGLFGYVEGATITDVHLTDVTVTATTAATSIGGGLVGYASGGTTITNCSATGEVTATSSSRGKAFAGGLVGYAKSSTITNCYATGAVKADSTHYTAWAGGLVGRGGVNSGIGTITNSVALNPWVNASGGSSIKIGRFLGENSGATLTGHHAWRHMGLNISNNIVNPVSEGGNNATNASTVMIWGSHSFYEGLSWDFTNNWTMSNKADYKLPILKWQSTAPAVDASHLNKTHEVNATATGGTITPSGKQHPQDGKSVTFTITPNAGYTLDTLTDNGVSQTGISTSYTIPT